VTIEQYTSKQFSGEGKTPHCEKAKPRQNTGFAKEIIRSVFVYDYGYRPVIYGCDLHVCAKFPGGDGKAFITAVVYDRIVKRYGQIRPGSI
jgi:hypothetical protein